MADAQKWWASARCSGLGPPYAGSTPSRTGVSRRHFLATTAFGALGTIADLDCLASDPLPPPRFVLEWGKNGTAPGEFSANVGLAIGKNDEIYTCEFRNHRIQRFTPDGKFLGMFPVEPHAGGIAVDANGN